MENHNISLMRISIEKQKTFLCTHIHCNTMGSQPDGSKWVRILEIILDEVE